MQHWLEVVWEAIRADFSDLPDLFTLTRFFIRLLVASILGGMLGYQRTRAGKPAGLRTYMLVSVGAAFFVLVPLQADMPIEDLSRVIQGVITGIGFLGAGAILKGGGERSIRGLTTAAGIWLTAAIGVAAGMGQLVSATFCALGALVIFAVISQVEWALVHRRRT